MCGRSYFPSKRSITSQIKIDRIGKQAIDSSKEEFLLPGSQIPTIVSTEKYGRVLTSSHWGYGDIYNARAETIELTAMWSRDYFEHRAILPVKAFFEGKWFTSANDGEILWAAAIYRPVETKTKTIIQTSMITVEANQLVRNYHHRMPALIDKSNIDKWLNVELGIYESIREGSEQIRVSDALLSRNN